MLKNTIPTLGSYIHAWIDYYDKYILNTGKESKYSAVDLIRNIIWTTRGKIDLAETAKNILANEESYLTDYHKYRIACMFCLEDEIFILAPKVVDQYYSNSFKFQELPVMYFWTGYVKGDYSAFYNLYPDYFKNTEMNISIHEFLWFSISSHGSPHIYNNVLVAHLWSKLNDQEKARNVISLIENTAYRCNDFQYALLTSLDYQQQQDVFKECSGTILKSILNDWLWKDYFLPIALHVLDIIDTETHRSILDEITTKILNIHQDETKDMYDEYKYIFKKLWQESPMHLKHFYLDFCSYFILQKISWKEDMDVVDLVFKDMNAQQKKDLIFDREGINTCRTFIEKGEWDLLGLLINYALSSEQDISALKERLVSDGDIIASNILSNNSLEEGKAFDEVERFMTWALESEEAINDFRQNLVYGMPFGLIFRTDQVDLTKLEKIFEWCAKGDPELIKKFKSEILELYGRDLMFRLIENSQYDTFDQVLNWSYLNDKQQIAEFKSNVYKNLRLSRIFASQIKDEHSIKVLDRFIGWAFSNQQQVEEFKMWLLYPPSEVGGYYSGNLGVCARLLREDQFKLADEFINWCGISCASLSTFKNTLILSDEMWYVIDGACYKKEYFQLLMKWFNPSKETTKKLKEISNEKLKNRYDDILPKYLDEFIESQNLSAVEETPLDSYMRLGNDDDGVQ